MGLNGFMKIMELLGIEYIEILVFSVSVFQAIRVLECKDVKVLDVIKINGK